MSLGKLALLGGPKVIDRPLKRYNPIGHEEVGAATAVVESGVLSQFIGAWHPDFYGGPKVIEFERMCESYFGVQHAVTVNSWTSGLIASVGSIGIEPGDEVIVTPWTMCATVTAILHWNAIPVFADIDPVTYCIDPDSIEKCITPYTRAIVAVDIFGHSADMCRINEIAQRDGLRVISDSAQSPGALYKGEFAGTLGDVGGFSLNYHKHIHTGEGGIIVTNDSKIAERLRLIRNHAEAVVGPKGETNLTNMIGYNFRLGEIECAIGVEQLRKLASLVENRQQRAGQLVEELDPIFGLTLPTTAKDCTHAYYVFPMAVQTKELGVARSTLLSALAAEGVVGLAGGYQNVHRLPMFQKKIAYGSRGFPWTSDICKREVNYEKGICPVAEKLHDETFMGFAMCMHELSPEDVHLVANSFKKVWANMDELRRLEAS